MSLTHIFDTSAWISAWHEWYAPDVFPHVWSRLADSMHEGTIASPQAVIDEITKKDDELNNWIKTRHNALENMQDAPNQEVEDLVKRLRNDYENLSKTSTDYYVIAWAKKLNTSLVTTENPTATSHKKIPGVCREEDVTFQSPLQFMQEKGWEFHTHT